jgi:hypothetical protein
MPVTISGTNGVTFPDSSLQAAAASPYVLKNRIINGDMRIDQRNAGASVTPSVIYEQYTLDRWDYIFDTASKISIQQNAGSVTPPTGFTNYLGATTVSAYSVTSGNFLVIAQKIEGYNISDLAWGTANAKTITLSFWVRSSLTGTFGGSLRNSDATRSYAFTYTISSANTWEQKTITITGDTSGTYLTTNGIGVQVNFGLGVGSTYSGTAGSWASANYLSATGATSVVGTSGATFYITGVQLEQNTSATPFERRLYNQELANCQRYYYKVTGDNYGSAFCDSTTGALGSTPFQVQMRIAPTALETSGTAAHYAIRRSAGTNTTCNAVPTFNTATPFVGESVFSVASGLTAGQGVIFRSLSSSSYLAWSAEL